MSSANEKARKQMALPIKTIETLVDCTGIATGNTAVGITVPAKSFVIGATLEGSSTLASGGSATLAVTVGSTAVVPATAIASVTNNGVGAIDATPDYSTSARTVYLTVATASLTAGTAKIKVLYV